MLTTEYRKCPRCGEEKHINDFSIDSTRGPKGRKRYCKPCANEVTKQSKKRKHKSEKAANRYYNLKYKYGLNESDVEIMKEEQNNKCAICWEDRKLNIDHCHTTGVVRGLLCNVCNTGLGKVREDPDTLRRAVEYIENVNYG